MAGGRHVFEFDNGNKFYIRRYEPFLSLEILGEVQKKFLPPLASLMEANDPTQDIETRMESVTKAVEAVSRSLDGKSLIAMVRLVLNPLYVSVEIQSEPAVQLDEAAVNRSCEDVADVIKLVIEVLRYNYERLFTQGRILIGQGQSAQTIQ